MNKSIHFTLYWLSGTNKLQIHIFDNYLEF